MNWDALGAIGDLIGGIAVIGSLVYVGLQVRQSNAISKSESLRELASEAKELFLWYGDQERARIMRRGLNDFNALSNNDQTVASAWFSAFCQTAQTTFAIRSSQRASQIEHYLASCLAMDGFAQWWNANKPALNPQFVETIEELAARTIPIDQLAPWMALEDSEKGEA
ncbi:MAG: hypothetical protein ACI9BW_002013 [Gammaproteobacteria bacterium]|jgi:hypothetical protein